MRLLQKITAESQQVNGHSYANKRTANTNFALLVSEKFTEPFKEPIAYGQHVARLANMLSGGILVQRFGDLLDGRLLNPRKNQKQHNYPHAPVRNAGDLSLVLPYRQMTAIIEMLQALDQNRAGCGLKIHSFVWN